MMKRIILSATMLSGLALTACVPLDSDKVGLDFNFQSESTAALAAVNANALTGNGANEGASYKSNFDPTKSKYSAAKGTTAGLGGVDISSNVHAIANGTSRIKNGGVWDRVQNHPMIIGMDIQVNLSIDDASNGKIDSAKVKRANMSIQGKFGTDTSKVTAFKNYESDPDGKLKDKVASNLTTSDFIPTGGTIKAIVSDGDIKDYVVDLLTPQQDIKDQEFYGAYRNGDQYSAFYAAGTEGTAANQVKDKATASKYDINFRGIASWSGTDYDQLSGVGGLNVNFNAGTYTGDITVKDGANAIGEIKFAGSSSNTVTFSDNGATYTPTGKTAVKGYVEGSAYGNDAASFMGTTDFADGADVLVGAFNAKAK